MEMILRPNGIGTQKSYVVDLPNRAVAVLDQIDGKGWELTIRVGGGQLTHRGLFATTDDVIGLLEAEYCPQPLP
jgi:hypothetical protein